MLTFKETKEGKIIACVQKLNGCHHGGVAVPVAVLVVEAKEKCKFGHNLGVKCRGFEPADDDDDTNYERND